MHGQNSNGPSRRFTYPPTRHDYQDREVVFMRGLSGSGKSHLARQLVEVAPPGSVVLSADDYFMKPDPSDRTKLKFQWSKEELGQAHEQCLDRCIDAMERNAPLIVIDNTNILWKHMVPYHEMCRQNGYHYSWRCSGTEWAWDVDECFKRNIHGVSREFIAHQRKLWQSEWAYIVQRFNDRKEAGRHTGQDGHED